MAVYSHRRDKSRRAEEESEEVEPALLPAAQPVIEKSVRSESHEHALLLAIIALDPQIDSYQSQVNKVRNVHCS